MGCRKITYHEQEPLSGNWKFFVDGIEKSASGSEICKDYYAFGSLMPGRNASSSDYRYGFNGKEKLDEIDGVTGSKLDFGARIYDSRLGRFFSADPKENVYPFQSTYAFAANSPIMATDEEGEGPRIVIYSVRNTGRIKTALKNGNYKKVARIIRHSLKNNWVNNEGTPNTYEARQMRKAGVNAPLNVSATGKNVDDAFSIIQGYEKDGEGGYKKVNILISHKKAGVLPNNSFDPTQAGHVEYVDSDGNKTTRDDAGSRALEMFTQMFGGGQATVERPDAFSEGGDVTRDQLQPGDTFRVETKHATGNYEHLNYLDKDGKQGATSKPKNKKLKNYPKLKQN